MAEEETNKSIRGEYLNKIVIEIGKYKLGKGGRGRETWIIERFTAIN